MKGITEERQFSKGSIQLIMIFQHLNIEHKVHLVPDSFPIPTDGIIGKDFLRRFHCNISYYDMTFTVQANHQTPAKLSIHNDCLVNNHTNIPKRSETFQMFKITANKFPCLIETQAIDKNVIIPTTIAYEEKCYLRVLNVNDIDVQIQNNQIKTSDIDDFDICLFNKSTPNGQKSKSDRNNQLSQILNSKMPRHVKNRLLPICFEFSDIFHLEGDKPSVNNFYTQELSLTDSKPVFVKNYRLPQSQKSEIHDQVRKLLSNDLIEMSTSNFNSPLIVVPKKSTDGTPRWRVCVDFRLLNRKLLPDKFPLPRIDEILDSLGRAKFFSVMDLQAGFHQIPLSKKSRPYTAFSTDNGFYQWKVLPFGLNVAPSSFTRMMTMAFSGLSPDKAFIYMDDIIVIGISEDHHINNLRNVFQTCRKFNLKINPEKCDFFRNEVHFLGHTCTNQGISPNPTNINVVQNYPCPKDGNETKRFVALVNYYRRFIPNFAKITQPLNELTRKNATFNWTNKCQKSFEILRNSLTNPPILVYPDFTKQFRVTVDASMTACAAYLSQDHNGIDKPISFISRSFKKGELNKPIIEKELIAIHFAISQFRPYIYGTEFTVFSDHKPLLYLYRLKNPSSKLNRLRLDLEEYTFDIVHIPGKNNVIADALSRIHIEDLKDQYTHEILAITRSMTYNQNKQVSNSNRLDSNSLVSDRLDRNNNISDNISVSSSRNSLEKEVKAGIYEEFYAGYLRKVPRIRTVHYTAKNAQLKYLLLNVYLGHRKLFDCELNAKPNERIKMMDIFSKLEMLSLRYNVPKIQWPLHDRIFNSCEIEEFKQTGNKSLKSLIISLIRRPDEVKTKEEKMNILNQFHNDPLFGGHCGQKRLYSNIRSRYFWKNMTRDIAKFVRKCHTCKLTKPGHKTKEPMKITKTPLKPFDLVQIDTIGPLPKSNNGNSYAVTIICDLTKYLIAIPVENKSAKTVAKAIVENCMLIFGPMRSIRTDLGTEYINELLSEILKLMEIKHEKSTAYHHESLGTIERNHRLLNEYLRAYLNGNLAEWDRYLNYFTFCYNTSKSTTNDAKYSPFELVFGRKNTIPTEILDGRINPIYNYDNYAHELKLRLQLAHKEAKEIIDKIKQRNKSYYDKNMNSVTFKIGDQIKIATEPYNKHKNIFNGPFNVIGVEDENVIIDLNGKSYKVHKNRIMKY